MSLKFPNISRFIATVVDKHSKLNPIYRRNYRVLLQSIPMIGLFVDANTLGFLDDRVSDQRINKLEEFCEIALTIEDDKLLFDEINKINSIFFHLIIEHQESLFKDNQEMKKLLMAYIPRELPDNISPNQSFCLITISGASASGKDTMLDLLYNDYFHKHYRCELLTKVTTREKRIIDSRYYKFLANEDFQKWLDLDRIIFPYQKREFNYGFDKLQFSNSVTSDTLLFCVFTEFQMLPEVKQFLKEQNINVISILLESPEEHLISRSWNRILPESEIRSRLRSIKQDLYFIQENRKHIEDVFDYIIYSGDGRAKLDTYKELHSIVSTY